MACQQSQDAPVPADPGLDPAIKSGGDELLSTADMYAADAYAAAAGLPGFALMEAAGSAVAKVVHRQWPQARVAVLCGPGNNGGDGFVAARYLREWGHAVALASLADPRTLTGDAGRMAGLWRGAVAPLDLPVLADADIVLDALFGAGLSRPLNAVCLELVRALKRRSIPVIAVDVPSGLSGDLARPLGAECIEATLTVTFFRKKPAHVLMPGRALCGRTVLCDIGIPQEALSAAPPRLWENSPRRWLSQMPWPDPQGHKYARGHCLVVSGPAHATGAARLAARAALRGGAGLVSIASPGEAVAVNAAAVTAIMVKPFEDGPGLANLLGDRRLNTVVIGPGCGVNGGTRTLVEAACRSGAKCVLDADALTSFAEAPESLFALLDANAVLTPHAGEFERIFPALLEVSPNRIAAARSAAHKAGCTVILKGPDSVIAAPDGRAVVNSNAPAWLATAGAGDVLSGLIGGLLAQHMEPFAAACAAVWLHGQAASRFGLGLIAEDLPELLPPILNELHAQPI